MAFETGTASDYIDLWDKLLAFLTENEDLVANGENWTIAWQAPSGAENESDLIVQGPGSTGTDEILVGLRRVAYPTLNSFFIRMVGMTGANPLATSYTDHVNVSRSVVMYLDQNPMKYWFAANGRRFVVVVKISTVYEAMYGGFFLPYADPSAYPYPLAVGASGGQNFAENANWTSSSTAHTHFIAPYGSATGSSDLGYYSNLFFLDPSAQWITVDNGSKTTTSPPNAVAPWKWLGGLGTVLTSSRSTSYPILLENMTECLGGGFALHPATLVQNSPANQTWGVLDGIYHVPGINNAAENIITLDEVDHLVVQNVFRTGGDSYWALAME